MVTEATGSTDTLVEDIMVLMADYQAISTNIVLRINKLAGMTAIN